MRRTAWALLAARTGGEANRVGQDLQHRAARGGTKQSRLRRAGEFARGWISEDFLRWRTGRLADFSGDQAGDDREPGRHFVGEADVVPKHPLADGVQDFCPAAGWR